MNGAEALVTTAVSAGIEICFANPGTTELPLVMALDPVPGLRSILCLHENVATGAADGYGRMAGSRRPASLGSGSSNGLTNLHNARRAFTPLLNVIGDHATRHLPADPLLATDVKSLAHTVSDYVKKSFAVKKEFGLERQNHLLGSGRTRHSRNQCRPPLDSESPSWLCCPPLGAISQNPLRARSSPHP